MSVDKDDYNNDETPEVNKGGRPSYEPNEKDEAALAALLYVGFPHRQIALYMNKNIKTLKKHYADLFETVLNSADKTAMVENALWYNAVHRHNVVAQLSWLKAHRRELYSEKAQSAPDEFDRGAILEHIQHALPN